MHGVGQFVISWNIYFYFVEILYYFCVSLMFICHLIYEGNFDIMIPWRRPPPTAETLEHHTIKSHPNYNR